MANPLEALKKETNVQKIIDLLQSRTVWAGLIAAIASIASILGVNIGLTDELTERILGGIAALAGILAIFFRADATKKIGGGSLT